MDGNKSTPIPEQRPASTEAGSEQLSSDTLEAKVAPAAAEAAGNQPQRDDGVAAAQTQMASVTADDTNQATAATPDPSTPPAAGPAVAADVDVIEPEWVKKAEEAVAAHRNDPREEEKAVEDLQREYLKNRYNLDVKSGDEKP